MVGAAARYAAIAAALLGPAVLSGSPAPAAVPAPLPAPSGPVLHQDTYDPRESGVENVRRRLKAGGEGDPTEPYWETFELKNTGRCTEAIGSLRALAERGRGYEYAQHALGLCLLNTGREAEAHVWISRAAEAGLAEAQATLVRLFVKEAAPFTDPAVGAQWLYLYQNNPIRLSIGAANALEPDVIAAARARMPRDAYLRGIGRARLWTPTYWQGSGPPG